jgi:hypothetical protein
MIYVSDSEFEALSEAEKYEYDQCVSAQSEQIFNGDADTLLNRVDS